MKTGQVVGVEVGRTLAMLGVCFIHVTPQGVLGRVLAPLAAAAVPFFFVASGYFLPAPSAWTARSFLDRTKRVASLWMLWSVVYSAVPPDWLYLAVKGKLVPGVVLFVNQNLDTFVTSPLKWCFDGPTYGFHLWFLPALLSAHATIAWSTRYGVRCVWLPASLLFFLGLLAGPWEYARVHLPLGFDPRN